MNAKVAQLPTQAQHEISVDVKQGGGQAAFFADVEIGFSDHYVKILGCPVWRGGNGQLQPDLPTKPGTKNTSKRFAVIEVDEQLRQEVFDEIRAACQRHGQGATR